MRFIFYSPVAFEKWDWRNSIEKGIGGSETSHVEMAWRLAAKGHEVITYAPIPKDCKGEWRDTKWYPIEEVDWKLKGFWMLYRCPEALDNFTKKHPEQQLHLMMQDWDYQTWTKERVDKLDGIIPLCKSHAQYLIDRHPEFKKKIWISSNGVKVDDIAKIKRIPNRNPKRIMYASSPDRGLLNLLRIFSRAQEYVPDLELHAFYGFNNLNKLIKTNPQSSFGKVRDEILELMKMPGVHWHGRTSQKQLYLEWFKSGIWCYPTNFWETSCITCMEAQAMGAIPVFSPCWALGENVLNGYAIEGNADDRLVQARFAAELVRVVSTPEPVLDQLRHRMMGEARARFSWEQFVLQWICKAEEKVWPKDIFPFQL